MKKRKQSYMNLDCFVKILLYLKLNKILELRKLSKNINELLLSDTFIKMFMKTYSLIYELDYGDSQINSLKEQYKLYKETYKIRIIAHPKINKERLCIKKTQLFKEYQPDDISDLLISKKDYEPLLNKRFGEGDGAKVIYTKNISLAESKEIVVGWVSRIYLNDKSSIGKKFTSLLCDVHLDRKKINEYIEWMGEGMDLWDLKFAPSFNMFEKDGIIVSEFTQLALLEPRFEECKVIKVFWRENQKMLCEFEKHLLKNKVNCKWWASEGQTSSKTTLIVEIPMKEKKFTTYVHHDEKDGLVFMLINPDWKWIKKTFANTKFKGFCKHGICIKGLDDAKAMLEELVEFGKQLN